MLWLYVHITTVSQFTILLSCHQAALNSCFPLVIGLTNMCVNMGC